MHRMMLPAERQNARLVHTGHGQAGSVRPTFEDVCHFADLGEGGPFAPGQHNVHHVGLEALDVRIFFDVQFGLSADLCNASRCVLHLTQRAGQCLGQFGHFGCLFVKDEAAEQSTCFLRTQIVEDTVEEQLRQEEFIRTRTTAN